MHICRRASRRGVHGGVRAPAANARMSGGGGRRGELRAVLDRRSDGGVLDGQARHAKYYCAGCVLGIFTAVNYAGYVCSATVLWASHKQMFATNPKNGKQIRIMKTGTSIWKDKKTLTWMKDPLPAC